MSTLCLRGYIPAIALEYVLSNPSQSIDFELNVFDLPIGKDTGHNVVKNPHSQANEPINPAKDCFIYDNGEIVEDWTPEAIAPRPLPAFTRSYVLDINHIKQLTSIRRLVLTRHVDSSFPFTNYDSWISTAVILEEWKALLRATRNTIQYLIIDQRPCLESYAADQMSISSSDLLRHYGCGKGWQDFERIVLPVLLKGRWPELRVIHLHGFHVPEPK